MSHRRSVTSGTKTQDESEDESELKATNLKRERRSFEPEVDSRPRDAIQLVHTGEEDDFRR